MVNAAVIVTATGLGRLFTARDGWRRAPQLVLGTVFVGLALRLAFDKR
jgi:threonine/homoserine/homoserine lactone efflux protein